MSDSFPIVIHHNPDCGTSRNVLAMIQAAGYEPVVLEYLKDGWSIPQLEDLMAAIPATPRDLLREKGTPARELGLLDPDTTDEAILREMVARPILVNRPIVVTPKGGKLCRPSEVVLSLLDRELADFTKENGERVRPSPAASPPRRCPPPAAATPSSEQGQTHDRTGGGLVDGQFESMQRRDGGDEA